MAPHRLRSAALLILLVACATGERPATTRSGDDALPPLDDSLVVRQDYCCAEAKGTVGADTACTERGCTYRRSLWCTGVQPEPEEEERHAREAAACRSLCACVCPEDEARCASVP